MKIWIFFLIGVLLPLAASPRARAHEMRPPAAPAKEAAATAAPAAHEAVEEIDEIEDVTPVATEPPVDSNSPLVIAGRLHPAAVHLPIAWLLLLLLLDLLTFVGGREQLAKCGFGVMMLTVLSFIPAVASGLLNAAHHPGGAEYTTLMTDHRNLMLVVAALVVIVFSLRAVRRNHLAGGLKWLYLALLAAACGLASYAGHLGGKMVYGVNYLPF